jgi:drug/metabolite transporter (DMT)-like permease
MVNSSIMNAPLLPENTRNLPKGIFLIVVAFLCVAIMSAFGKAAANLPTGPLVFFQNGISLLLFAPFILRHGTKELRTTRLSLHIVRALTGLLSQALFFIAVKNIALVDAVLLANAAPLFIPIVALLWMRTAIRPAVIASLLVGFVGVIMILKPSAELLKDPAALIAISAAAFSAVALVSVNRLSSTDKSDTILFYYFFISTVATLPFAFMQWQTPQGNEWLYLLGVGVFMSLSQLFIILAYKHATAAQIAPFNYSVVIFSGIIGWMVWNTSLDLTALLGIALVCVGGIASIMFTGKTQVHAYTLSHSHHAQKVDATS